jgi:EF hand
MRKQGLAIGFSLAALALVGLGYDAAQGQQGPQAGQAQQGAQPADPEDGMMTGRMMGRRMMGRGMMGDDMMPAMMGHHGPMGRGMMMRMMFSLMDADGDGSISLQEFQAAHERIFKGMDQNKDGRLTIEEMRSFIRGGGSQ